MRTARCRRNAWLLPILMLVSMGLLAVRQVLGDGGRDSDDLGCYGQIVESRFHFCVVVQRKGDDCIRQGSGLHDEVPFRIEGGADGIHAVEVQTEYGIRVAVGVERGALILGQFHRTRTVGNGMQLRRKLRSEEHTSELQSLRHLVCRLLLEKKKKTNNSNAPLCHCELLSYHTPCHTP